MIKIIKKHNDLQVSLIAIKLGEDINVCIYGGDNPHIGAVALAVPDEKHGVSASVIAIPGHREDVIAREYSVKLSNALGCKVCILCGIHKDNATFEEINIFCNLVEEAIEELRMEIEK